VSSLPLIQQLIEFFRWLLVSIHDHIPASLEEVSWGLAIILLTILVRLVLFPLTWKQFRSSQAMQSLQPKIKELQKKYKSDRAKLQQETMKLYQEHQVNPFASCMPLLLQLPVFISLYYSIRGTDYLDPTITAAINNASFLWIDRLGDPNIFLLVLYVITQLFSTELMVTAMSDPRQKWMMRAMPFVFVVILINFPAGLFLYWITTNLWTIGQQLMIRKLSPRVAVAGEGKPRKRSRFMESMMAAQEQAARQREEKLEANSGGKSGGAQGSGGKSRSAAGKPGGKGAPRKGGQPAKGGAKKQKRPPGQDGQKKQGGGQARPPGQGGQQAKGGAKKQPPTGAKQGGGAPQGS
jgi:YidC/Oxa1 family membrane protein insertase